MISILCTITVGVAVILALGTQHLRERLRHAPDASLAAAQRAGGDVLSALLLVLIGISHASLGIEALLNGESYKLLLGATPLIALTLVAAVCTCSTKPAALRVARVAVGTALVQSVLMLGFFLVGIFHIPQAVLAMVVVSHHAQRSTRQGP